MHALTMTETVALVDRRVQARRFTQHVVINVAKLIAMRNDRRLRQAVLSSELLGIDGMGVVWGLRLLGYGRVEKVSGIDLFFRLLDLAQARGYPVFLLGARPDVVEQAVTVLRRRYPDLEFAGWHHGYFWDREEDVVARIGRSGARLLFVAISSPKKELFVHKWRDRLGVDFVMGIGGTLDVVSGRVRRAPVWMQRYGLEWFYRLVQEPRRLWKRYATTNLTFAWLLAGQWLRKTCGGGK